MTPVSAASPPALRAVARRLLASLSAAGPQGSDAAARVALWAQTARACAFPDFPEGEAAKSSAPSADLAAGARQLALACLPGLGSRLAPLAAPLDAAALLGKSSLAGSPGALGLSASSLLAARAAAAATQASGGERDAQALCALAGWLREQGAIEPLAEPEAAAASAPPSNDAPPGAPARLGQRLAQAHAHDARVAEGLRLLAGPAQSPAPEGLVVEPDWRLLAQANKQLALALDREPAPVGEPFRRLMGLLAMLASVSDRSPALAVAFSHFAASSAQTAAHASRAFLAQDPAERESGLSVALLLSQLKAQALLAQRAVDALQAAFPRPSQALRAERPAPVAPSAPAAPLAPAACADSRLAPSALAGGHAPERGPEHPFGRPGSFIREPLQRLDRDPGEAPPAPKEQPLSASALPGAASAAASQGFWGDPQALWEQAAAAGFARESEQSQLSWAQSMAQDPRAWKGRDFGVLEWAANQDELAQANKIADWGPFIVFLLSGWPFGGLLGSIFSGLCFYRPAKRSFSNLGRAFVALKSLPPAERDLLKSAPGWRSFLTKNISTAAFLILVNIASFALSASLMGSLSGMGGHGMAGAGDVDMQSIQKTLGALSGAGQ